MVVTRAKLASVSSISNFLNTTLHLDDEYEEIVLNICSELRLLEANHPNLELAGLELSIAQLVRGLDNAAYTVTRHEALLEQHNSDISALKSKLEKEKELRRSDFNDSIAAQDLFNDEKDTILSENSVLKSKLNSYKSKLSTLENDKDALKSLLNDKDSCIGNLNLRLTECQQNILELESTCKTLLIQVNETSSKTWLRSRWLDDKILDDYFNAFSNSANGSQTLFFTNCLSVD